MKENIIKIEEIRNIKGIPEIAGYRIVENFLIDKFFSTLNSHSTDLYLVRLYRGQSPCTLMYGSCVGNSSKLSAKEANQKYGAELTYGVGAFAAIADQKVTSNRVYIQTTGRVTIMASRCDKGFIIAGWHNSNADSDISKQMLAYVMMNFAALNAFGAHPDKELRMHTYDTIPTDSRLGTFDSKEAKQIFLAELYTRNDRMSLRRQNHCTHKGTLS